MHVVPFDDSNYIDIMMNTHNLKGVASRWNQLGLQLGVPYDTIQEIGGGSGVADCLMELLGEWIRIKPNEATIQNILKALKSIDDYALAEKLPETDEVKAILIS